MKKVLVMLLIGTAMFSQSKTTVRGVTMSYDKVTKVLILDIPQQSVYTNDSNIDVGIEIHKQYVLKVVVNGITRTATDPYFQQIGHTGDRGCLFSTTRPYGCSVIKRNYKYKFTHVVLGDEFILEVSTISEGKYTSNIQSGTLLID